MPEKEAALALWRLARLGRQALEFHLGTRLGLGLLRFRLGFGLRGRLGLGLGSARRLERRRGQESVRGDLDAEIAHQLLLMRHELARGFERAVKRAVGELLDDIMAARWQLS